MALQFDAYNETTYAATSTPSVSVTVPSGATIVVVGVTCNNNRTMTATLAGNAMTLIRQDISGDTGTTIGFFYYVNPSTGSNSAVATLSSNDSGCMFIAAILGTATTTPIDTNDYASTASATTKSTALTTTQAKTLLVSIGFGQRSNLAAGGGETQGAATLANGSIYQFMSYKYVTSSGSNSMTATLSPANWINISSFAVKEAITNNPNFLQFF